MKPELQTQSRVPAPIPASEDLIAKSREVLGFNELCEALSARAESEPGKQVCLDPPLFSTVAACEIAMTETAEMTGLFDRGEDPPGTAFQETLPIIKTASAGGMVEPLDMVKLMDQIGYAGTAKTFYSAHPEAARLKEWAERLDRLTELHHALERSIDRDGAVLDSASPELKSLRNQHRTLMERIHRRLSEIVARDPESILQDNFFTQRGQRYVVPVRATAKNQVDGIVHDASASGQTVFVEPTELVEPNNRMKMLEAEIEAEVLRVLRDLSAKVSRDSDALLVNREVLVHLDVVRAKARLGSTLKATRPRLNDRGIVSIRNARHPLIALTQHKVVGNDLDLGGKISVLLISGPNAGGKSVGLSMLGLFALMARAGIFISAAADSEMAVFSEVYAVIGDDQDLSRDLSSFSAHMLDIIGIVKSAGDKSLVLMDELMNSTDPEEGAALAAAVLSALRDQGARVMATTHLPKLKGFAHSERGFLNAGYAFDPENFAPTYKLVTGAPGRSLGLAVASRLGLPETLVRRAWGELDAGSSRMEDLLGELSARLADLAGREALAEDEWKQAKALKREAEELRTKLNEQEREFRRSARTAVRDAARQAEEELAKVLAEVKGEGVTKVTAMKAKEKLKAAAEKAAAAHDDPGEGGETPEWAKLKKGDKVRVMPLLVEAEILESPGAAPSPEAKIRVRIGKLTVSVEAAKVRSMPPIEEDTKVTLKKSPIKKSIPERKPRPPVPDSSSTNRAFVVQTERNTLDLRGQRYIEAESKVDAFLDQACRDKMGSVFIIHGHGTGALRRMVRENLGLSPYVETFRPGGQGEGGDGVTVVTLKDLSYSL